MSRKIEKIYSGDRIVKIRILPEVKKGIGKIEKRGVEIGGEVKEVTVKTVEKAEEKIAEVKEKVGMTVDEAITVFTKIPTITKEKATSLYDAGYNSLSGLARAPAESLLTVKNITFENVKNIKKELKVFYEEEVKPQIEKAPAEKTKVWIEDVTKRMISIGKDTTKKAKTGAITAKQRVSETYKKLATPEKTEQKKKEEVKPKKRNVKHANKKTKKKTSKK